MYLRSYLLFVLNKHFYGQDRGPGQKKKVIQLINLALLQEKTTKLENVYLQLGKFTKLSVEREIFCQL